MTRDLSRLLHPKSIAVIGGGAWCEQVIHQSEAMEFDGEIWPVHPRRDTIRGRRTYPEVSSLPKSPDAAFVGINRHLTIETVRQLSALDAGGAVCFASGFSEARAEDSSAEDLQTDLIRAAGDMPILGPNCYGFINALDRALLWPDQHGCRPVDRGVAILTQSSNIAINLTMQRRALPIAYMVTCGNMAQTSQAEIAHALLDDPRVTAIGLHIEGFTNLRAWEALAKKAWTKGKPMVALKVGASEQAQQATVSHTASLAGSDAGAQAFLDRLGVPRVSGLPEFLETLKLLHCAGPLQHGGIASISCSGGEASLVADLALPTSLGFPALIDGQKAKLEAVLGPMVALSNPLDYHTYVWRDEDAMTKAWAAMTGDDIALTLSVVDYPVTDGTDWQCATKAAIRVQEQTGAPFAVVSSLPELLPEGTARNLMTGGVVPLMGLREALVAAEAATQIQAPDPEPLVLPGLAEPSRTLSESDAKQELARFGLMVPKSKVVSIQSELNPAGDGLQEPFAVKGLGLAHKSEHGAVKLGVTAKDLNQVIRQIGTDEVLIEEMITGTIAELLVGVTRDPAHGYVLTLGAGGVLTELLRDTRSLLLPVTGDQIRKALNSLNYTPVLNGYRGKPAADLNAIVRAVESVQAYVLANAETVSEVEINPLICTPDRAVAADALIRKT